MSCQIGRQHMPQLVDLLEQATYLHPKAIDLSLGRCRDLLRKLNNPHRRIPPTFHVAGTNGKGSTIAFAKQILEDNGYAVHVYTSPHLVRFNERIQIANWRSLFASDDAYDQLLADTLAEILQVNAGAPATQFEIITCLAFLLFSRYPADYVLLETGLGGQYDATNVIENPIMTAITSISFDHTEYLGSEIADIAFAKAGIIKRNVPVMIPHIDYVHIFPPVARHIIRDVAKGLNAPVLRAATRRNFENLGLLGDHQKLNATVALCMIYATDIVLTQPIEPSLQRTRWAGRLQKVMYAGTPLWLDSAHNEEGAMALAKALKDITHENTTHVPTSSIEQTRTSPSKQWTFFVHIKARKDVAAILAHFAPLAKAFYIMDIPIDGGELAPVNDMIDIGKSLGVDTHVLKSVNAMSTIIKTTSEPFIATGSLFWVGELLKTTTINP